MAKLQEVQDALAAQTAAVVDLGADVAAAKTALDAVIARLEALIAAGAGAATEADLQGILDGVTASTAALSSADAGVEAIKGEADAEKP